MKNKEGFEKRNFVFAESGKRRTGDVLKQYVVYPFVLLCMLLGVIFITEDNISLFVGINATEPLPSETAAGTSEPSEPSAENKPSDRSPYVIGIDDSEPLAFIEYYYLNRDVLPDDIYGFNYNLVPEGELGIIPVSLAREAEDGVVYIKNSSKYNILFEDYTDFALPIEYEKTDDYTVLILHTHTTESYTPDGVLSDNPNNPYLTRSEDNSENVVAVGAVMADVFEQSGIHTLHHTERLDFDSRSEAYEESEKIILEYLEEYPSIKYVFDVHRDGLTLSTGEKAKVICEIENKRAAQVMFVVGTDTLGQNHPDWENNLAFAVQLQVMLDGEYPNFCRPINVKQGAFNQHHSPMGLLLEIGTDGNTLDEAEYAAVFLAEKIAELIKST